MGTLASELGAFAGDIAGRPRLYVDANMPAGLVTYMRARLGWDVLFVVEHADLRRARDDQHYRLARQLRRTLVTLDRDYLDDRRFPPGESGGVLVLSAPEERGLAALLLRLDAEVFRGTEAGAAAHPAGALPLEGRKLHIHPDWPGITIRS